MTKEKIQKLADKLYPIVPLECSGSSASEILDDDEKLENFRLNIQSVSSNMAYVKGFIDGQSHRFKMANIFKKK